MGRQGGQLAISPSRVLIVHDQAGQRRALICQMQERWGPEFQVVTVPDCESAIAVAKQQRFDAIVIDLDLSVINIGPSIMVLRQAAGESPIFAFTAIGSHSEACELGRHGVDELVEKRDGSSVGKLIELIETWVPGRRTIVLNPEEGLNGFDSVREVMVKTALRTTGGNRKAAARDLKITVRHLRYYIHKYEIDC